jgi:hypothetical protein
MVWKVSVVKHCVLHDTLVVGPWCIRRNSIHPSAWKGYSQKFAICRGLGKPSVPWKFTEDSSSLVTVWAGWVYLLRAAPSPFPSRSWESPGPTLPLCLYSPGCLEVVFWELLRVDGVLRSWCAEITILLDRSGPTRSYPRSRRPLSSCLLPLPGRSCHCSPRCGCPRRASDLCPSCAPRG